VIDLHAHILPALDDGARDLDDALELARAAVADGVHTIAATPHVRGDYPTTAEQVEEGVRALRAAFARENIELELLPGGELSLDALAELDDEAVRRFGLGGNRNVILIEMPYVGFPTELGAAVRRLRDKRITPLIAHPERNADVHNDPERLEALIRSGALVQITAASIDGRLGRTTRATTERLLELELAHTLASDAHTPDIRAAGLSQARRAVGDALGRWLTEDVPDALIRGIALTTRPPYERAGTRRFWRR
jgi:protein-tyrosine phosphatase